MKILALLPVRNEAWVLRQTLGCLSGFCDVILVGDQASEDDSRAICREFPKVSLIENDRPLICEAARFQLLDAARDYDGENLLWMTDADELVSPASVLGFVRDEGRALAPGTVIELLWCQLWNDVAHYRDDESPYAPQWKPMAFVDDRTTDYDRSGSLPLHRSRVPEGERRMTRRAEHVAVLHLQWLLERRNQTKQAWYRCAEWVDGEKTAAVINATYAVTLTRGEVKTSLVPSRWTEGIEFPVLSIDEDPSWQEHQVLRWFEERGVEFFEPLEIWHVSSFRDLFVAAPGRHPRPDRSYRPAWSRRARSLASRAARTLGLR